MLASGVAQAQQPYESAERAVPQNRTEMQLSFSPVVKKVAPAVVNIYTSRKVQMQNPFLNDPLFRHFFRGFGFNMGERTVNSLGSGVIIGSEGLVVTSNHVIQEAQEVRVVLNDRREFDGKVVLTDEKSDLALLRIQTEGAEFPFVPLRNSDTLEVGDLVLAVGNPFGVGQTVTSGIISALARTTVGVADFQFFIQTDAAINPGNSGGALVDMEGNLIGVNTAIYSTSGASNGIGFAIPANMVQTVLASAISGNTRVVRPWLGVSVQRVTSEIAESMGMEKPQGVLVTDVADFSPARRAGVQVGDVVVAINGHEIFDEQGMQFRTGISKIGEKAVFQVSRNGRLMETRVEMVAPPENPARDVRELNGQHFLKGVVVANLSPAVAIEQGMDVMEKGVTVIENKGNPMMRRNDVLVQIDSETIRSTSQLEQLLQQKPYAQQVIVKRDGKMLRFTLR
jgi:Do/DeqQ family serine protease